MSFGPSSYRSSRTIGFGNLHGDAVRNVAISRALGFLGWKDTLQVARTSLQLQKLAHEYGFKRSDIPRIEELSPSFDSFKALFVVHEERIEERGLGRLSTTSAPVIDRNTLFFLGEEDKPELFISHQRQHIEIAKMLELFHMEAGQRASGGNTDPALLDFLEKLDEYLSYWLVLHPSEAGVQGAVWERREASLVYFALNLQSYKESIWVGMYFSDYRVLVNKEDLLRGQAINNIIETNARRSPFEETTYDALAELTKAQNGLIYEDLSTVDHRFSPFNGFSSFR